MEWIDGNWNSCCVEELSRPAGELDSAKGGNAEGETDSDGFRSRWVFEKLKAKDEAEIMSCRC